MQQQQSKIYFFQNLNKYPNIKQLISTRQNGDIRKFVSRDSIDNLAEVNFRKFLNTQNIPFENTVGMQQRHTNKVRYIADSSTRYIQNTDGVFTDKKNIFLYAIGADCLPIVFADAKNNVIGVLHAGFKGLEQNIVQEMVGQLKAHVGNLDSMQVGIGPGICEKCYSVDEERIKLFADKYVNYFMVQNGKMYLNLREIAVQALMQSGISKQNIEIMDECTYENREDFFSYRADSKETFGHFATLIGLV